MDVALRDVDALLAEGIVVGDMLVAGLHARRDERLVQRAFGPTGLDPHRATAAAIPIGPAGKGLGAAEVGQTIGVAPALQAKRRPVVVVPGIAPHPVHAIDRGRAAEDPPARLGDPAIAQLWFRFGLIGPVEPVVGERHAEGGRHPDEHVPVGRTRLEQQDPIRDRCRETAGDDTAGRAGPDDHIVVGAAQSRRCGSAVDQPRHRVDTAADHRRDRDRETARVVPRSTTTRASPPTPLPQQSPPLPRFATHCAMRVAQDLTPVDIVSSGR